MPFQSEAQRRYLWANEPEIARDWADTYGSRIEKYDGGISQLVKSGPGRPGYKGDDYDYAPGQVNTPYSGGPTLATSGGGGGNPHLNVSNQPAQNLNTQKQLQQLALNNAADKQPDVFKQPSQFNPLDYIPFIGDKSLSGMAIRGVGTGIKSLGNLFKGSGWDSSMGPRLDMGYNPNKKPPTLATSGGGDGQQQQYPPWWYEDYAENILEDEEELDIDTSTGDMDEWVQRFRVKDPYRQDRGALDPQIKEYISKLYTTP